MESGRTLENSTVLTASPALPYLQAQHSPSPVPPPHIRLHDIHLCSNNIIVYLLVGLFTA